VGALGGFWGRTWLDGGGRRDRTGGGTKATTLSVGRASDNEDRNRTGAVDDRPLDEAGRRGDVSDNFVEVVVVEKGETLGGIRRAGIGQRG
jgi:hypothetical protein